MSFNIELTDAQAIQGLIAIISVGVARTALIVRRLNVVEKRLDSIESKIDGTPPRPPNPRRILLAEPKAKPRGTNRRFVVLAKAN